MKNTLCLFSIFFLNLLYIRTASYPFLIKNTKDLWELKNAMDMKKGLPKHFQSSKFKSQYFQALQGRLCEKGQDSRGEPESFLAITQIVWIVECSNYYFWNPRKISYKIDTNLGQIEQKLKFSFFKILFFKNIYFHKNQSYWSNWPKIAENVNHE